MSKEINSAVLTSLRFFLIHLLDQIKKLKSRTNLLKMRRLNILRLQLD